MTKFSYVSSLLYRVFKQVEFGKRNLGGFYKRFWNPINYGIVGGIGVAINYLVFALVISSFPWWITNALAILTAWTWNWSMSVGPLGYLWGFKKRTTIFKEKGNK